MSATTEELIWLVGQRTRFEILDDVLYLHADNGWSLALHSDRRIRPAKDATFWIDRIVDIHDSGMMLTIVTDAGTYIDVDLADASHHGPAAMVLTGPGDQVMAW